MIHCWHCEGSSSVSLVKGKVKEKVGFFYSATYTGNAATSSAVQP